MAVSKVLQNPRTINKIDPVDIVVLNPPPIAPSGLRVLIADPVRGDHATAIATGVFAGRTGQIALADGFGNWTFENKALYLDNQLVPVGNGREIWIYWQDTGSFERSRNTLNPEYNEFLGYLRNQAGEPNYSWTQHTITGSVITQRANGYEFELKDNYIYTIRHRIIATRTAAQEIGVGLFVNGTEVSNSFYGTNPNNYSGSGTFEYRLKLTPGSGTAIVSFRDLTGSPSDNHDAILSIETVAMYTVPVPPPIKSLSFIQYRTVGSTQTAATNTILFMDTIGITSNTVGVVETDLQDNISATINYVVAPLAGNIIVNGQVWNTSNANQRVNLVQEDSNGNIKRQWGNFFTANPKKISNATTSFSVDAGDRLYYKATNAFAYTAGLGNTELGVSYISFS